jgi:CubicO group peptidase (beta-lactamase class C family)
MDPKKFADLEYMVKSRYRNINGMVVVRKGYIVFERYYNGYSPLDAHNVASVTKSFISALIGIAIDAGCIKSVNQKVLDFFPEYVPNAGDIQKRIVTIRHLLTMTAPIASKTTGRRGDEPLDRLRRQRDWVMYILNLLGRNGQLGKFQYSTAGSHLLSTIITRTTGMCAREFANERLFRHLGMQEIPNHEMKSFGVDDVFGKNVTGWIKDPNGNTTGGWGLTITSRDMARFGFLYLNRGVWDNEQIISEKWIDESTALNSNRYGYLWWLREEGGIFAYSALGSGGNVICCIPAKDLVVAIASKIISNPHDRWPLFEECIIPAVKD